MHLHIFAKTHKQSFGDNFDITTLCWMYVQQLTNPARKEAR